MLNDLPADIDVIDELDISKFEPVIKNYVFSSYFFASLLEKTLKENKELKKENATLKARLDECAQLKAKFEELKQVLDAMGDVSSVTIPDSEPDKPVSRTQSGELGFMASTKAELENLAEGETQPAEVEEELKSLETASFDEQIEAPAGEESPSDPDLASLLEGTESLTESIETVGEVDADSLLASLDESLAASQDTEEVLDSDLEALAALSSEVEPIPEPAPEPVPEPIPEPAPEPAPEPIPEPVPEPAPEPSPAPKPAVEMPTDPNAKLTPEQIAALFGN